MEKRNKVSNKKDIILIHGCPYDLKEFIKFIKYHLVGDQLNIYFGENATSMYYAQHSPNMIN